MISESKIIGHDVIDGGKRKLTLKYSLNRIKYFFRLKRMYRWAIWKRRKITSLQYKIFHGIDVGGIIGNGSAYPELGKSKFGYISIKRKKDVLQFNIDGKEYRIIPSTSSLGFYFEEIEDGKVKSRNSFQISDLSKNSNAERA